MRSIFYVIAILLSLSAPALANGGTPQADEHASPVADDHASDEGMLEALCNAA